MRSEIPIETPEDRQRMYEARGMQLRIFTVAGTEPDETERALKREIEERVGFGTKYGILSKRINYELKTTKFDVLIEKSKPTS